MKTLLSMCCMFLCNGSIAGDIYSYTISVGNGTHLLAQHEGQFSAIVPGYAFHGTKQDGNKYGISHSIQQIDPSNYSFSLNHSWLSEDQKILDCFVKDTINPTKDTNTAGGYGKCQYKLTISKFESDTGSLE